jgi:hypothetical protein
MNQSLIDNIDLDGIDPKDAPDYSDAFICSAHYDGQKMTEAQLDKINDDSGFVHEQVLKETE